MVTTLPQPGEIRIELHDAITALALNIMDYVDQSLSPVGASKLAEMLVDAKIESQLMTPRQIHAVMAQIGFVYCKAAKNSRDKWVQDIISQSQKVS